MNSAHATINGTRIRGGGSLLIYKSVKFQIALKKARRNTGAAGGTQ
jgi:hypothetical protein